MASDNGITIGQLTEQLNQKMDLPTGISQDTMDYVVEWKTPTEDDTTWYRKYKSGWVEQGGFGATTGSTALVVPLPLEMQNTSYCVQLTTHRNLGGSYGVYVTEKTINTFSMKITVGDNSSTVLAWEVKGQGAE